MNVKHNQLIFYLSPKQSGNLYLFKSVNLDGVYLIFLQFTPCHCKKNQRTSVSFLVET